MSSAERVASDAHVRNSAKWLPEYGGWMREGVGMSFVARSEAVCCPVLDGTKI